MEAIEVAVVVVHGLDVVVPTGTVDVATTVVDGQVCIVMVICREILPFVLDKEHLLRLLYTTLGKLLCVFLNIGYSLVCVCTAMIST